MKIQVDLVSGIVEVAESYEIFVRFPTRASTTNKTKSLVLIFADTRRTWSRALCIQIYELWIFSSRRSFRYLSRLLLFIFFDLEYDLVAVVLLFARRKVKVIFTRNGISTLYSARRRINIGAHFERNYFQRIFELRLRYEAWKIFVIFVGFFFFR